METSIDKSIKDLTDEEVVSRYIATQKMTYFNIIYRKYSGKIFGKCISLLKNEEMANDAVQDIFMKIILNMSKFNEKSKFSTWIYSITYNYCIDVIRSKKKLQMFVGDGDIEKYDKPEDVDDAFLLEKSVSRLKIILNKIPIADKAILLMKYQDELSIKEISRMIDKSESAVKMKLKRAKQKFKNVYSDNYKD